MEEAKWFLSPRVCMKQFGIGKILLLRRQRDSIPAFCEMSD